MLTGFVALQDIEPNMGPTTWIRGTHTEQVHDRFYASPEEADAIMKSGTKAVGTLAKGSCVIFDPRTLHCAGGNDCVDPNKTRALFYFSFKNPRIDHPGSPSTSGYGIADADVTMEELCDGLSYAAGAGAGAGEEVAGRPSTGNLKLDAILSFP